MKRILYVEDNEDTAEAVKIILTAAGYQTDTANEGKSGMAKAMAESYDLILLDIMLPDMSGWDIFEKLKKKISTKYAFLSAIPVSSERIDELRKNGVSDYIMKPFTKSELVGRINIIFQ